MSSGSGVVEWAACRAPLTGQELRVRNCLRDLSVDFESHVVFVLFEDVKVIVDFLVEDCVVLECMYSRCKSNAHSWFLRNGTYIDWKFRQIKKQKQQQRQGGGNGCCEGQEKNNAEDRGEFLCVAFFEAPNYYKEKELPEILKKCMPHADAIFSSIKDLKEYLRKQKRLQKLVTGTMSTEQQPQTDEGGMVKLEHFLPETHRKKQKTAANVRSETVKGCIGGQL